MTLDQRLFVLFNERLHNAALDWFMPAITNAHTTLWFWLLMAPILLWVLLRGSKRAKAVLLLLAILIPLADLASSFVLKPIFHRPRPTARLIIHGKPETVVSGARLPPHTEPLGTSSFPSSHSTVAAALATTLILAFRRRSRWVWFALLIPILIGYSRVYVGVHYPLDVLGGWIFGTLVASLAWYVLTQFHGIPDEDPITPSVPSSMTDIEKTGSQAV